jgi:hypothetical protein
MDTKEKTVPGITQVPYWDYMRVVLALGYVCTELEERMSTPLSEEMVALARQLAGAHGREELEHVDKCFSGLYDLFRQQWRRGGFVDEPE